MQDPEVKEKVKQTNLNRRGVEWTMQDPEVQEKTKQTHLENRGVEYLTQDPEIQEKIKQTNLKNRGVEYPTQDPDVREKAKHTNLERRGVEWAMQDLQVQEKSKQTNVERYGTENPMQNPMQNPEIAEKSLRNAHKYKDYILPSGKVIKYQGYEHWYLDHIFQTEQVEENDVIFGSETTQMPEIWYEFNGSRHRYYPDLLHISSNLVVEVKSTWTYDGDGRQEEAYIQ